LISEGIAVLCVKKYMRRIRSPISAAWYPAGENYHVNEPSIEPRGNRYQIGAFLYEENRPQWPLPGEEMAEVRMSPSWVHATSPSSLLPLSPRRNWGGGYLGACNGTPSPRLGQAVPLKRTWEGRASGNSVR